MSNPIYFADLSRPQKDSRASSVVMNSKSGSSGIRSAFLGRGVAELNGSGDNWIRQTMNHHPSNCENTGLLVSIRSVAEAIIAQNASCVSIIDLKEPSNGSLGCVSFDTAKALSLIHI